MITVDLLRHGALEGGVKYRGSMEEALTPEGRQVMDAVWQQLRRDCDLIISSPRSRCARPARDWAAEAGIECIIESRIAEMAYGDWEGLTKAEIEQRFPGQLGPWRQDPTGKRPPNGESPEELKARIGEWWDEVCSRYDGRHLLVVGHSGSLRMLLAHVMDAPIAATRRVGMPYACWSRIVVNGDEQVVEFMNREA
jgi:alpha-ribazole phosphatase/probable phosphoglycerate mutase